MIGQLDLSGRPRLKRRFLIAGFQSHTFNLYATEREIRGPTRKLLAGDVVHSTLTVAVLISDGSQEDPNKLERGGWPPWARCSGV